MVTITVEKDYYCCDHSNMLWSQTFADHKEANRVFNEQIEYYKIEGADVAYQRDIDVNYVDGKVAKLTAVVVPLVGTGTSWIVTKMEHHV